MPRRMCVLRAWVTAAGIWGWVLTPGPTQAQQTEQFRLLQSTLFSGDGGPGTGGASQPIIPGLTTLPSVSPGLEYAQPIGPGSQPFPPGPPVAAGPSLWPRGVYPAPGWSPALPTAIDLSSGMPCACVTMPTPPSGAVMGGTHAPIITTYDFATTATARPFKVADGTGPIRIHYGTAATAGRITVTNGRLGERKELTIELVRQVTGPDWVRVEVFADVPRLRVGQPLGTFYKPGRGGVYKLDVNDMERVAANFVSLMNNLDYFSAARPIPAMTASLRITGDNPRGNASPIDLPHAVGIEPDLVVAPAF